MNNVDSSVSNLEDRSSDGEEDFESADEGEGKEKVSTSSNKDIDPRTGSVPRNIDELSGDSVTESSKQESDNLVGDKASHLESTESILEPLPPVTCDIRTSVDKDNIPKGTPAEESEETTNAQNIAENSENRGNDKPIIESGETNESANTPAVSASSGWGWGSWGAVLNQATNTMTSGLSQVIEKVETTLGIPEPGELQDEAFPKDEKSEVITMEPKPSEIDRGVEGSNNSIGTGDSTGESFFTSWGLTSLSNAVTSKGLELVSDGIDALETIGKKTMDVISEGDPGFRAKREMFKKPSLSQILREAKEENAKEAAEKKTQEVLEKVNFNDEFDRFQGLAHLEALEILSRECEAKIESVLIDLFEGDLEEAKRKLRAIEEVFGTTCTNEDDREQSVNTEFAVEIGKCAMALNLAFVPNKLNQTEESISKWLEECATDQKMSASSRSPDDIYSHVITSLADITAKSIEVFRKVAEMILMVDEKDNTVTAEDRASHLYSITKVVTNRISTLSTTYAECLNKAVNETEDNDNITPLITEVYLECSNSSSHVQDAFKLLVPVLQVSALNNMK